MSAVAQEQSLWHADAAAARLLDGLGGTLPAAPGPVDLLVIGSGYAGLSCALHAARAGAAVLVLDAGPIAGAASSLNGGTYGPGFPVPAQQIAKWHGRPVARAIWDISARAAQMVGQLADDMELDCFRRQEGNIKLAVRASHFDAMRRYAGWLHELTGQGPQPVSREELPAGLREGPFAGGLLERQAGQLHPRRFAAGLAALAVKCGARIVPHTPVLALCERPDGCTAALASGEIRARRVLVATNRPGKLLPACSDRLIEIGSYMIATEPLPPAARAALFHCGQTYSTSKRLFHYFRMDHEGRVLFGGRNSLLPGLSDAASRAELRRNMSALLPALAQAEISHSWGGRLTFFRDALPRVGAAGPRLFFALGFGGQGLTMATFGGMLAAELIVGQGAGRIPFDLPLPLAAPIRPGPHALRLLSWFYRMLDAIG